MEKFFSTLDEPPEYDDLKCYIVTYNQWKIMEQQAHEKVNQGMLNHKEKQKKQEQKYRLCRERIKTGNKFVQCAIQNYKEIIYSKQLEIQKLKKELDELEQQSEKEMYFARKVV